MIWFIWPRGSFFAWLAVLFLFYCLTEEVEKNIIFAPQIHILNCLPGLLAAMKLTSENKAKVDLNGKFKPRLDLSLSSEALCTSAECKSHGIVHFWAPQTLPLICLASWSSEAKSPLYCQHLLIFYCNITSFLCHLMRHAFGFWLLDRFIQVYV